MRTFDVHFDDQVTSNNMGWRKSYEYCRDWIECNRDTPGSYFSDYVGGEVSIICNESGEVVYREDIQ